MDFKSTHIRCSSFDCIKCCAQYFLKDAIGTECSVKRRCSASNVMTLIEYSRRPDIMSKHALTLCLGNLSFHPNQSIF